MGAVRHILTAFLGGELDPLLDGRVDTEQYAYGLHTCENFIPLNEGPLVKRQGFEFIRPAAATACWLSLFRRATDQEYVLEWSNEAVRFYTQGGRIEADATTPYELATPYVAAKVPRLSLQQSYDRLYVNHGDYPPAAIRRDSATTFAFETLALENGPFKDTNTDESVTVSASAATGSGITVTASSAIFAAGHVGALLRMEARDFADIPAWETQMKDIAIGDKCTSDGKVYEAATAGTTGTVQPTHAEGAYYDGLLTNDLPNDKGPYGVKWTYLHDRFGVVKITAVASGTSATATVQRRLPDSLVSGTTFKWAHQAFSAAEGWPQLVTLWKGRRVDIKDFSVVGSVVNDYGGGRINYAAFTDSGALAADLSFRRDIATEDPPHWLATDRKLLLGTASQEIASGPVNAAEALSGSNIEADPQSFYGSEPVWPVKTGTETIFVERGGRRIRSADYDFARDRYDATDLTASARHITTGGVVQLAFQRVPNALLVVPRGDGQMAVHPKTRADMKGWCRFKLGGGARCLSAVSAVGSDGKSDDLWLLVERENGAGDTVREVWKQAAWRELGTARAESFFVDGGTRVEASAGQTDFTGFTHLASQAVAVLANGGVVPNVTVASDGSFSIPAAFAPAQPYTLMVGHAYSATAVTMRPEAKLPSGTSQGLKQRLLKAVTRIIDTFGLKLGVPGGGAPEPLRDRSASDAMDEAVPLYSGDSEGLAEAEFDREGRARWISEDPLPAVIALAVLKLEVSPDDI